HAVRVGRLDDLSQLIAIFRDDIGSRYDLAGIKSHSAPKHVRKDRIEPGLGDKRNGLGPGLGPFSMRAPGPVTVMAPESAKLPRKGFLIQRVSFGNQLPSLFDLFLDICGG